MGENRIAARGAIPDDDLPKWFPDEMETRRNDYVISMIESQE